MSSSSLLSALCISYLNKVYSGSGRVALLSWVLGSGVIKSVVVLKGCIVYLCIVYVFICWLARDKLLRSNTNTQPVTDCAGPRGRAGRQGGINGAKPTSNLWCTFDFLQSIPVDQPPLSIIHWQFCIHINMAIF